MQEVETKDGSEAVHSGVSVVIERSPAEVFAALTNVASHTDWARGPEEITAVSDNPARLGTTWQQSMKLMGRKLVARVQVSSYEENSKFGFGSDKPFPMEIVFTLVPVAGGTELRMTGRGQPANIFGKVAMPLITKSLERQMESDLYALKAILENGA